MKQFPPSRSEAFEKERVALKALKGLKGIVQYIGWYECTGEDAEMPSRTLPSPSPCILLELATCDLNEAMMDERPPALPDEIKRFWEELVLISEALVSIHAFEIDGTVYHGSVPTLVLPAIPGTV